MNRLRYLPTLAAAAACLVLALLWGRPTAGQAPAAAQPGRYQIATGTLGPAIHVYLLDTSTGRIWHTITGGRELWAEMKAPAKGGTKGPANKVK